jgi:hypothetical protein
VREAGAAVHIDIPQSIGQHQIGFGQRREIPVRRLRNPGNGKRKTQPSEAPRPQQSSGHLRSPFAVAAGSTRYTPATPVSIGGSVSSGQPAIIETATH